MYLVMFAYPNALSHPNCFQSIYAYSKVNVCSCSAADRPSDDVVVEAAGLEQAPGVQGSFYIACCSEQPQGSIGIGIYNSKCLFSTYSYGYASQQHNPAHSAEQCSDACAALMVIGKPCGVQQLGEKGWFKPVCMHACKAGQRFKQAIQHFAAWHLAMMHAAWSISTMLHVQMHTVRSDL